LKNPRFLLTQIKEFPHLPCNTSGQSTITG
jgi:hypothetical protein